MDSCNFGFGFVDALLHGLCRRLAKHVGTQVVARHRAAGGLLDGDASFGGDAWRSPSCPPVAHHGLTNAEFFRERGNTAGMVDCFVECVHGCRSSRFVLFESTLFVLDGHHGS